MSTESYHTESCGAGKYHVRLNGNRIPGIILGGNGHWVTQVAGIQQPAVKTLGEAARQLVENYNQLQTERA